MASWSICIFCNPWWNEIFNRKYMHIHISRVWRVLGPKLCTHWNTRTIILNFWVKLSPRFLNCPKLGITWKKHACIAWLYLCHATQYKKIKDFAVGPAALVVTCIHMQHIKFCFWGTKKTSDATFSKWMSVVKY